MATRTITLTFRSNCGGAYVHSAVLLQLSLGETWVPPVPERVPPVGQGDPAKPSTGWPKGLPVKNVAEAAARLLRGINSIVPGAVHDITGPPENGPITVTFQVDDQIVPEIDYGCADGSAESADKGQLVMSATVVPSQPPFPCKEIGFAEVTTAYRNKGWSRLPGEAAHVTHIRNPVRDGGNRGEVRDIRVWSDVVPLGNCLGPPPLRESLLGAEARNAQSLGGDVSVGATYFAHGFYYPPGGGRPAAPRSLDIAEIGVPRSPRLGLPVVGEIALPGNDSRLGSGRVALPVVPGRVSGLAVLPPRVPGPPSAEYPEVDR